MTRGFEIWSQNLNQQHFNPFLAKNGKNWQNPIFDRVLAKKGVQMPFDLNFETRFEILSSFPVYLTPFCENLQIVNFWSPIVMLKNLNGP